jgi:hypothetical protein
MERDDIIPIPLRADFVVRLHIPTDLTEAEAEKIARVVKAYAGPKFMRPGDEAKRLKSHA